MIAIPLSPTLGSGQQLTHLRTDLLPDLPPWNVSQRTTIHIFLLIDTRSQPFPGKY